LDAASQSISPPLAGGKPRGQGGRATVVAELHRRASTWYAQNGFPDEAIEHALRGEHFERAAHLVQQHVDNVWLFSEHAKLRRWLDGIPTKVTASKPHLGILDAGNLFTTGQVEAAERRLQAAERALGADPLSPLKDAPTETDKPRDPGRRKLLGRAAVVRSHLLSYRDEADRAIQYARQALELLPESDAIWRWSALDSMGTVYGYIDEASAYQARLGALDASKTAGNAYMILLASLRLVVTLRDLGRLQQAVEICEHQFKLANDNGLAQTALVGWLYALWGEMLAEIGELDRALQLANDGVALTERGKDVTLRGSSYLCLMRVLYSKGELNTASGIIQGLNGYTPGPALFPWIRNQLAAWQARIWLAQGRLASATRWADEVNLEIDGELTPLHDFDYAVLARLLIVQGRLDEASRLLRRLFEAAEAVGRTSKVIEIRILQALTVSAAGDAAQALNLLERALTLAQPGGFVRIFVDEGPPMARLLAEAASGGMMPTYTGQLLAAFAAEGQPALVEHQAGARTGAQSPHPAADPDVQPLVEPLSSRELEVLRLITEGLSNREIAQRLFLALSTVKGHNRNIYGKLEVGRRTEAVARARELGLL
jgi:LuxR family maltose regulon positive regulatory protein